MNSQVSLKKWGKTLQNIKGDRVVVNPTVSAREKEENVDLYDGYTFIGLGSMVVSLNLLMHLKTMCITYLKMCLLKKVH